MILMFVAHVVFQKAGSHVLDRSGFGCEPGTEKLPPESFKLQIWKYRFDGW
jgi:hypothetical protein